MENWIYHNSTGVCQMLVETSFQIINMYSIGGQNPELLWH